MIRWKRIAFLTEVIFLTAMVLNNDELGIDLSHLHTDQPINLWKGIVVVHVHIIISHNETHNLCSKTKQKESKLTKQITCHENGGASLMAL